MGPWKIHGDNNGTSWNTKKHPAQQITKLEQQCLSKSFLLLLLIIWFSNKNPDWMTNERHGCQRLSTKDYGDTTTSRSKSASQLAEQMKSSRIVKHWPFFVASWHRRVVFSGDPNIGSSLENLSRDLRWTKNTRSKSWKSMETNNINESEASHHFFPTRMYVECKYKDVYEPSPIQ